MPSRLGRSYCARCAACQQSGFQSLDPTGAHSPCEYFVDARLDLKGAVPPLLENLPETLLDSCEFIFGQESDLEIGPDVRCAAEVRG